MKRAHIILSVGMLLAINIASVSSCSSAPKNENSDDDSLLVKVEDGGYEYSMIYYSENARNAHPYKKGEKYDTPLSVNDSRAHSFKAVDTDDIWGGYENGALTYSVALLNTTNDTIVIDSFEFPDTRFKASIGTPFYGNGYLSWVKLETDSPVNIKDYRFIINYKGDKYPSQTIHINLYSNKKDADMAYEERTSEQEE